MSDKKEIGPKRAIVIKIAQKRKANKILDRD